MKSIVAFVIAVTGMVASQRTMEVKYRALDYEKSRLASWSGPSLRHLFAGFELAAADLYWLQVVQYYGGQRAFAAIKEFELVEPLVENVVTLDPRFAVSYQLGAIFLAEPPPVGLNRPETAVRLLERGIGAIPDNWFLHRDAALFRFEYLGDSAGAVARLRDSASLPGAPAWLSSLSADLATKAGNIDGAREIWRSLASSDLQFVRENAQRSLMRLDALALAAAAQKVVDRYREQTGSAPAAWRDLVAAGLLREAPRDQLGTELGLMDGRVVVSRQSPLWRPNLDGAGLPLKPATSP